MNHQLTTKEMLMLEENLRLTRSMVKFAQGCSQQIADPQLRALCQQVAIDHNNDLQVLSRYMGTRSF